MDPQKPAGMSGKPLTPLAGIRVLTLEHFGAGPYGSAMLAELGAEVIKVEDPAVGGDSSRGTGADAADGDSLFFQAFNRGKKSITLDLKHPDGRAVLRDLARVSHAVFNNLRGDQPAKLGLDYAALSPFNPKIVCLHISAYGRDNERAARPGFD